MAFDTSTTTSNGFAIVRHRLSLANFVTLATAGEIDMKAASTLASSRRWKATPRGRERQPSDWPTAMRQWRPAK